MGHEVLWFLGKLGKHVYVTRSTTERMLFNRRQESVQIIDYCIELYGNLEFLVGGKHVVEVAKYSPNF